MHDPQILESHLHLLAARHELYLRNHICNCTSTPKLYPISGLAFVGGLLLWAYVVLQSLPLLLSINLTFKGLIAYSQCFDISLLDTSLSIHSHANYHLYTTIDHTHHDRLKMMKMTLMLHANGSRNSNTTRSQHLSPRPPFPDRQEQEDRK